MNDVKLIMTREIESLTEKLTSAQTDVRTSKNVIMHIQEQLAVVDRLPDSIDCTRLCNQITSRLPRAEGLLVANTTTIQETQLKIQNAYLIIKELDAIADKI